MIFFQNGKCSVDEAALYCFNITRERKRESLAYRGNQNVMSWIIVNDKKARRYSPVPICIIPASMIAHNAVNFAAVKTL